LQDALNDPVRILCLQRVKKTLAPTINGESEKRVEEETGQKRQGQEPGVTARLASPEPERELNETLNQTVPFGLILPL
jgi:hypothetical protein